MLYHIVSGSSKLGQFRWSGFFSYQWIWNFFHRKQLKASTSEPEPFSTVLLSFQIESSETFLTSHYFHKAISYSVRIVKIGSVPMVWIFFLSTRTGTISTGINYKLLPADRNRLNSLSIFPKSNLVELFSRATFPQCYIILCQDRQN